MRRFAFALVAYGFLMAGLSGCSEKGSNIPTTKTPPAEKPGASGLVGPGDAKK